MSDPLWYKDAIIYELHIKAYFDSNDDGVGDFHGLAEKLDYLQDLGVTAVWLLPFYPSPQRDDGYDIADYLNVNPAYGSIPDAAFVLLAGDPYLVVGDELRLWSPSGYAARRPRPARGTATVITPPSLVEVLRAGWTDAAVPLLHPTSGV